MSGVCKFCGCTDSTPCIASDGVTTCAWVTEDVCSNPYCVEKAYREARQRVIHEEAT